MKKSLLLLCLLLIAGSFAKADTIGPNCGSCQGSTYTLTLLSLTSGSTQDTVRIQYDIDTTGYTGTGVAIDAAAIKVSSSVISASLFAAPGGTSAWNIVPGGIAAGGCSGSGSGFECADYISVGTVGTPVAAYGGSTPLTWIFDLVITHNTLFTGDGDSSVKARYVDASGAKVGALVSEDITLGRTPPPPPPSVPEPAGLLLLGTGLIVSGGLVRRRIK